MEEYVSGEMFSSICDVSIYDKNYLYDFPNLIKYCNEIIYIDPTINNRTLEKIKKYKIFFVKTDYIKYFEIIILPLIKHYFILVTHNSDLYSGNNKTILDSPYLIKWYGQNMIPHPMTMGIPIGLQNSQWKGHDYNICKINAKNIPTKLLYFNFNTKTHPSRINIENILINKGFIKNTNKKWPEYIKELSEYHFCVSPRGNGIDCHRIWECIYVGCIPIIKKDDILYTYFKDLPILWIEDYNIIDKEYLIKQIDIFNNYEKNIDKSKLTYWIKDIKNNILKYYKN